MMMVLYNGCMYICMFVCVYVCVHLVLLHVILLALTSLPPSSADGCMQSEMTAVYFAARNGHTGCLQLLHELGLDLTVKDEVSDYLYN
jgi:hypothetical protein